MLWLPITILVLIILIVIGLLWAGAWNPKTSRIAADFKVFQKLPSVIHAAHRGGSQVGPANTLETLKRSVTEFKCDVLEIDLQLTKDGHVILMHDNTIDATTNGSGLTTDYTLNDIQRFDAAYWFTKDDGFTYPLRGAGITIPTLEEVFQTFEDNKKIVYFLDFKNSNPMQKSLDLVAKYGLTDRIFLGSVVPKANKVLRKIRPSSVPIVADFLTMLKIFVLYNIGLLWLYNFEHEVVGFFVNNTFDKILTPGLLKSLRATGRKVAVFGPGINSVEAIEDYLDRGANIIVTDRPDRMKEHLDIVALEANKTTEENNGEFLEEFGDSLKSE